MMNLTRKHEEEQPVIARDDEPCGRILFPFLGSEISGAALDAALRLAKAEGATLVPAYLAAVPLTLPIDSPLPHQAEMAMPIIEAIEQRASEMEVPVDSRIERGRTYRHAMSQLIDSERYDRIIAPAAARGSDGFEPEDIAWLLANGEGEIVVFHPAGSNGHASGARAA